MKVIKLVMAIACVVALSCSVIGMTGCSSGKYSLDDCINEQLRIMKKAGGGAVDEAMLRPAAEQGCEICKTKSKECDKVVDALKKQ